MTESGLDLLYVAPAILASILEVEDASCNVGRLAIVAERKAIEAILYSVVTRFFAAGRAAVLRN